MVGENAPYPCLKGVPAIFCGYVTVVEELYISPSPPQKKVFYGKMYAPPGVQIPRPAAGYRSVTKATQWLQKQHDAIVGGG